MDEYRERLGDDSHRQYVLAMAKKQYSQLDSGLLVVDDSVIVPKPDIPRPWYVGRQTPLSAKAGNIQFRGGKILFRGGSIAMDPECCCDEYEDCTSAGTVCSEAPWIVDLGDGGWTNINCSNCPAIAGEFACEFTFEGAWCRWNYTDTEWCSVTMLGNTVQARLGLSVYWPTSIWAPPGDNYFTVWVNLSWLYSPLSYYSAARYLSDPFSENNCDDTVDVDGNITLDKEFETHLPNPGTSYDLCGGNLPASIILHRP